MNQTIVIIMAMYDEARAVIESLNLKLTPNIDPCLPIEVFCSQDKKTYVVVNGRDPYFGVDSIGTQAAAITTTLAIREFHPQLILSAGTAGAFKSHGASIGEVYLSGQIAFYDRRIALPGFEQYGRYIIETPFTKTIGEKLHYKIGNITTGNSLDMPDHDYQSILALNGDIKEMEAASVAWVSRLYGIEMMAVKSVTDLMDAGKPTEIEFLENLHRASLSLKDALINILTFLQAS